MKTNKNLFFVHNIFAITTKKNLFLFVFTGFFCFFQSDIQSLYTSAEGVILTSNSR